MSEYRNVADELRERRKGKPGELLLVCGLACMAISPFVLAIVHNEGAEYATLKAQGVVSEAQVTGHEQREETTDGRRGRSRTKTLHFLELRYDLNSSTSYAEWKASGALAPAQYPAMVTTKLEVPSSYLETNPVGAEKPVVFLRGDSGSMELVEQAEYETSFGYFLWYYLAMAGLFAAGLVMTVIGWHKRKAHG